MKKILLCCIFTLLTICSCFVLGGCKEDAKVTFDYGYDSVTSQITVKKGDKISAPQAPERDGYEFAGWYENEKLEKEFDFSKPVKANTKIYADWVSYTVQDLFSWVEVDGGIKLSTVLGGHDAVLPKDLIIPRVIDGQKVVELGNELLQGQCYPEPQYELTTVKIPYGVKTIGNYCFKDCYNLQSVTIPETVTTMGEGVFKMSSSYGMALKSVVLPSNLTSIPKDTFYYCSTLENVNIPKNVMSIGDYAFNTCTTLKNVTFPKGLESIGASAFSNCSEISDLVLPKSLKSIGASAFSWCIKNNIKSIPTSVTTIGDQAFAFNLSIRTIDIPSSITTLGRQIFNRCDGIIVKTTLTENAEGWDSAWNTGATTIYNSANNNLSSGNRYFIQDDCKYLIKTDTTDEHKYLSLEFCFKTDEKVVLDTKVTFEGKQYPVEEVNRTAFNSRLHKNVRKLIFNEGINGSKFTLSDYSLYGFDYLDYIVLPTTTQPLSQRNTYNYLLDTKIFTNLTRTDVEGWTYKENTKDGGYYIPDIYTIGTWQFVNGEPTPITVE